MKLKRTKLAALALTALMAVGATSLVAYAGETDTAAAIVDASTSSYTVDPNTVSSCVINSDGTATIKCPKTYANDTTAQDYETFTATVYKTTAATCQKNKIITYTYTYNSVAYYYDYEVADTTIDHTWSEVSVTTAATCTSTGVGTRYCTMCGKEDTVTLDMVAHTSKVTGYAKIDDITTAAGLTAASSYTVTATSSTAYWNIKVDSTGALVLGSDGLPQANIVTEDAYYYVTSVCSVCGTALTNTVVKIPATTASYAKISAVNKISNLTVGDEYEISEIPFAESTLELTNCAATDAYYVVEFYSSNDELVSELKVPVSAHHYTVTLVEFASKADADQCTVVYNTDGTYKITNNSCYKTITYYEVTHCAASGTCSLSKCSTDASYVKSGSYTHSSLRKISSVTKTVEPSGSHSIDETAKTAITTQVASGTTYAALYNDFVSTSGTNYSKYIKLVNNTSTCEADGTVDVQYICKICGEVVETKTVNVKAPGHSADTAVVENLVASTCSKNGSYDAVVYCVNKDLYGCTKVFSTTNVLIPRTKHTNEEDVTSSGVGTEDVDDSLTASNVGIVFVGDVVVDPGVETIKTGTVTTTYGYSTTVNGSKTTVNLPAVLGYGNSTSTAYSVYAYVASYCDVCGYEVMISKPYKLTLTVDSVTKESSDGTAGSITLTATYTRTTGTQKTFTSTQTFKYYSSALAYAARVESDPINGLNLDSDGVYRYYVDDEVDYTYSGIVTYNGGQFFVANGVLCSDANGLNLYNGTWYFLSQGQIQTQYTGFAEYDGAYFYIVKGVLATTVNGLVEYDGSQFLVASGQLVNDYNGLYQDFDEKWYFLALGQVQDYTGVAMYDGAFFKLVNGILDDTFTGTIEYDGATFNVVNGQLYDQVA